MTATSTEPVGSEAVRGLPADFVWGAATAAYQIEGAVAEDGRSPSVWDTFSHTPGKVAGGDTGDVACDHYHRMPEDVALLSQLGLDAYRFSMAWPRVQPGGTGPVNARGIAFYDRLVDELLARDITPWATLYHWDLPQALEDAGGWPERDTAHRFAEYAGLAADALGDRVKHWITLNEPFCSAMLGYYFGDHAPGRRSFPDFTKAAHHLLLGHGLAVQRIREAVPDSQVGITLNPLVAHPASDAPEDIEAARRADAIGARIYLDPVLLGRYPADLLTDLAKQDAQLPVQEGDLKTIAQPLDFLGVNYYFRDVVRATDEPHGYEGVPQTHRPSTAMPWEIYPEGMTALLTRLSREYPALPLYITENGAAFDDSHSPVDATGRIQDTDRTAYLADHLAAIGLARAAGADVRGYFCWSLMDNFEWAYGYEKRFGLVHVDYETQVRTPKASALWFRDAARTCREQ
ncbi:GH1 family beta-glucosidase [Streptomyces acidiscabies]|uniref:GH1 family beta-glucosidase n=1 Tax=Streptomyces acidiscabies TaxID=42234 RepID=UPI0038F60B9E